MMRARKAGLPTAVLGFFLLTTAPLHAAVVYEIETTDHGQSPPKSELTETTVEGRNLKVVGVTGEGESDGDMIFLRKSREIVFVDHREKGYFVMNEASIRDLAGEVNSAMSQMQAEMQKMLKDVPPDQRPAIEAMMKQHMPAAQQPAAQPKSELKKTSERAKKNGYPCVKYEVWKGGRKVSELWVTDWDNITGGDEAADVFEDMAGFFRELMDAMPKMGGGDSDLQDNMFEFMGELGGFPVVTKDFNPDGSLEGEMSLGSTRRVSLGPDAFEPPSGYERQEMFGP